MLVEQINQERDGNQVDKSLLKNVLVIYIECGTGERQRDFYEKDFEVFLLEETRIYYSRKASSWIERDYSHVEDICHNYWSKVTGRNALYMTVPAIKILSALCKTYFQFSQAEECLKKEKEIISQVLLSRSERKLMEV